MTIKNKLRLGFSFIFLLALVCCGLSIYYLNILSDDAKNILKDNYKTVQYMKNIAAAIDANQGILNKEQINLIEDNLVKQEHNITERGEQQLSDSLRSQYEQLKLLHNDPEKTMLLQSGIKKMLYDIMQLNMSAIEYKDALTRATGKQGDFAGGSCPAHSYFWSHSALS